MLLRKCWFDNTDFEVTTGYYTIGEMLVWQYWLLSCYQVLRYWGNVSLTILTVKLLSGITLLGKCWLQQRKKLQLHNSHSLRQVVKFIKLSLCNLIWAFSSSLEPKNWPMIIIEFQLVAQWLEHSTRTRRVKGSNPRPVSENISSEACDGMWWLEWLKMQQCRCL